MSVADSNFIDNSGVGVGISDTAAGEIQNCVFYSNGHGVYADKAARILLVNNRAVNNREHGIFLFEVDQSTVAGNLCETNGRNGIYIQRGNRAEVSQNNVLHNGGHGFSFTGKTLDIEMTENAARQNQWQGIYVGHGVEGDVTNNESSLNGQNGIYIVNSDVSVRENLFRGNIYAGICILQGSMGHIKKNVCQENQGHGIAVWDAFSAPVLEDNITEDNKVDVLLEEPAFGRVREMMLNGEYDQLDNIAARLIDEETRNDEGTWQLTWFHHYLARHWIDRSAENRAKGIAAVEQWIEHSPQSQTPSAVLAAIYIESGWNARGIGFAYTVTAEGWRVFYEELNKALAIAEQGQSRQIKDPEFYARMLAIGRGLGKPKHWMRNVFGQGLAIKKDYHPLYQAMGEHLLPKWQGSALEVRAFANSTIDPELKDRSHLMYAFIMAGFLSCESIESFKSHGFDYEKMKIGFEQILSLFPDSAYNTNRLCMLACIYGDKETARRLFPAVEKNTILSIWKNDAELFEKSRTWAFSEDEPTEESATN